MKGHVQSAVPIARSAARGLRVVPKVAVPAAKISRTTQHAACKWVVGQVHYGKMAEAGTTLHRELQTPWNAGSQVVVAGGGGGRGKAEGAHKPLQQNARSMRGGRACA